MICAQADPHAAADRRALFQADPAAHAAALANTHCDGRQSHGQPGLRADAAPDAVAVFAADNTVAYRLARRSDNESRAPPSRCSDANADAATLPAADAQT